MKLRHLSIALVLIFIGNDFSFSESLNLLRDPRQFRFGFEPTVSNIPIILESAGAVVKKITTGKGEGVLTSELPVSMKYRERYLKIFREECPLCKITETRESHGEMAFHIEFPDGFYINSSLDAGALEWQTRPSTVQEIRSHTDLLQKNIFDRAKKAGLKMHMDATGGHVTFSGFGNDSFWYGNYLKFRTRNTDLEWGYFAKDLYNAAPVSLWNPEQQLRYEKVHLEHDQKWEVFLKKLETSLKNNVSDAELMKVYKNRDVFSVKQYSAKLWEIYSHPELASKLMGERSNEPKYVANRPFMELIENRAIRPQKNAQEMLKMAEFIESEAWYVKEMMNKNLQVQFLPNSFTPHSAKTAIRNSRKVVEGLGLDWNDYVRFSKKGNVKLKGIEKSITEDFSPTSYGAAKRDQLFQKLRDHFLAKTSLSLEESVFLGDLLNEMSYTVPEAVVNAKHFQEKIPAHLIEKLPAEQANQLIGNAIRLNDKFPAATNEILAPVQQHLNNYVLRSFNDEKLTQTRSLIPLMESKEGILNEVLKLHQNHPSTQQLGVFADLALSEHAESAYLKAILNKEKLGTLKEVPSRFNEVAIQASKTGMSQSMIEESSKALAQWFADPKNASNLKVVDSDADMLHWLAEKNPQYRKEIYLPLRKHYLSQMVKEQFGITNLYETSTYFDYLTVITPPEEKEEFLQSMLKNVRAMNKIRDDADSNAFVERVEKHIDALSSPKVKTTCVTSFVSSLKSMFK